MFKKQLFKCNDKGFKFFRFHTRCHQLFKNGLRMVAKGFSQPILIGAGKRELIACLIKSDDEWFDGVDQCAIPVKYNAAYSLILSYMHSFSYRCPISAFSQDLCDCGLDTVVCLVAIPFLMYPARIGSQPFLEKVIDLWSKLVPVI